ncbi:hypothetical protein GCM10022198_12210 [Klugiella xanthotipulae]|uniref:Uncharacterized protein n=1 Tax=Klugiella xanthotipulae TaxID=244735 RepID=A0A543I3Z5_9MICO|nr:hypothetical protein [Klugiella xanthotipulae]TQM65309.1 hypothetical protein FB466_0103 [Klugiella xanthotipulae]
MTRGGRTWRGLVAAASAILLAALSHTIAGGAAPSVAGIVSALIVCTPVCIALAGRALSLWRLGSAVVISQGLFHAVFSYLAMPASAPADTAGIPTGLHVHGSATAAAILSPHALAGDAHSGWMWLAHAVAAGCTIAVLRFGERGAYRLIALTRLAVRRLTGSHPHPILPAATHTLVPGWHNPFTSVSRWMSGLSYRGPPAPALA